LAKEVRNVGQEVRALPNLESLSKIDRYERSSGKIVRRGRPEHSEHICGGKTDGLDAVDLDATDYIRGKLCSRRYPNIQSLN
jgi:hypothetical protein